MANGLGSGRAATSIGQMLMQKALFDQQRQDRELERKDIADLRREQAITSRLGTALAPGDTFLPYSPGMQAPPEGAQPLNVMGESGFRIPKPAPMAEPSFTATATQPGGSLRGTFPTPEAAGAFTKQYGIPEPPKAAGSTELPFGVSAGGITTRAGTPEEAIRLRGQLAPGQAGPARVTEMQGRMQVALSRAEPALQQIQQFLQYDPQTGTFAEGGGDVPEEAFLGKVTPGRYFQSADIQAYDRAAEAIASAILRVESGAAITKAEIESYKRQFIPRPGDKEEVIRQKLGALSGTLEAIRRVSGVTSGVAPAASPTGEMAPDELAGARDMVQGMPPERARAALQRAGFNSLEITEILGS